MTSQIRAIVTKSMWKAATSFYRREMRYQAIRDELLEAFGGDKTKLNEAIRGIRDELSKRASKQ